MAVLPKVTTSTRGGNSGGNGKTGTISRAQLNMEAGDAARGYQKTSERSGNVNGNGKAGGAAAPPKVTTNGRSGYSVGNGKTGTISRARLNVEAGGAAREHQRSYGMIVTV